MHQFDLQLFGSFQLLVDGQPVERFATDQARALLTYLIMHQGQPLRRDSLAALFWPDTSDKNARQNLRQTLSRVRRACTIGSEKPTFITTDYKTVTIESDAPFRVDALHFALLLDECETHAHGDTSHCATCQEKRGAAIDLYQGEFLAGFHLPGSAAFEEWMTLQRERFHRRAVETLDQLLLDCRTGGDLRGQMDHARALLHLEPWRETAHQALIGALLHAGEREEAARQYERCREVLAEELGVAPSAETVALLEQITVPPPTEPVPSSPGLAAGSLHHFPPNLTSFVGRSQELAQLQGQLQEPDCRLLTVIGPGGVGKTRLAIEAARTMDTRPYPDGIYFVPLGTVRTVSQLETALVESLGGILRDGTAPRTQLIHLLQGKKVLILLDTFEHLMAATDLLGELLSSAPTVQFLVTSREALNLQAEWRLNLHGLTYAPLGWQKDGTQPDTVGTSAHDEQAYSAVALFLQRAARTQPGFKPDRSEIEAIQSICALVDGLPLAIEMAAAWLRVYDCRQIATELAGNPDFLVSPMRDVPDRHRSMRSVFDVSWGLLADREQKIYAQLSVFRGAFGPEAAKAVSNCTPLDLAWLVDKSLLIRTASGRYSVHGLLRQFGAEHLADNPADKSETEARHAAFYTGFLASRRQRLRSELATSTIAEIEDAFDNIRRAWQVLLKQKMFAAIDRCVDTLYDYFSIRSRYRDGEEFFGGAADARKSINRDGQTPDRLYVRLRNRHAHFLYRLGQYDEAGLLLDDAATHPLAADDPETIFHQFQRALIHYHLGDLDAARACANLTLENARQANERLREADALGLLGSLALARSDYPEARSYYEQSHALYVQVQKPDDQTRLLLNLGLTVSILGERQKAEEYLRQCLPSYQQLGDREGEAFALCFLGTLLSETGRFEEAETFCRQSLAIFQTIGFRAGVARALERLGENTRRLGKLDESQHQLEEAQQIYREIGHMLGEGAIYLALARLALQAQDWPTATVHCADALHTFSTVQSQWGVAAVQLIQARVALQRSQQQEAHNHASTALAAAVQLNVADMQCDALLALAELRAENEPTDALKLCAFLVSCPLALYEVQEGARRLLIRLRSGMAQDSAARAIEAGRQATLTEMVQAELEQTGKEEITS